MKEFFETLIGKQYNGELIAELRKAGYVLRVVHKNGKTFPYHLSKFRCERVNVHTQDNKIIHFWIG